MNIPELDFISIEETLEGGINTSVSLGDTQGIKKTILQVIISTFYKDKLKHKAKNVSCVVVTMRFNDMLEEIRKRGSFNVGESSALFEKYFNVTFLGDIDVFKEREVKDAILLATTSINDTVVVLDLKDDKVCALSTEKVEKKIKFSAESSSKSKGKIIRTGFVSKADFAGRLKVMKAIESEPAVKEYKDEVLRLFHLFTEDSISEDEMKRRIESFKKEILKKYSLTEEEFEAKSNHIRDVILEAEGKTLEDIADMVDEVDAHIYNERESARKRRQQEAAGSDDESDDSEETEDTKKSKKSNSNNKSSFKDLLSQETKDVINDIKLGKPDDDDDDEDED